MPKSSGLGAYHSLGRPDALNWRVHVLFALPAVTTGLIYDYPRLGGSLNAWILLIVVAVIVPVLVIELLAQLVGKQNWKKSRPLVSGAILLIAGFARGLTFLLLGGAFGIVPATDIPFRLVGGPIFVLSIYMLFNYIVLARLDHRRISGELQQEREKLTLSRQSFEAELTTLRFAQMSRVRELLAPALWELGKLLKDASLSRDASSAIAALRNLNDQVVRPLSHSMASQVEIPIVPKSSDLRARVGQFVLPKFVSAGIAFQVTAFAPFIAVFAYSTLSSLNGPFLALLFSLTATSVLTGQIWLFRKLTAGIRAPIWGAVASTVLATLVIAGTTMLLLRIPIFNFPQGLELQVLVFFAVTMFSFLVLGVVQLQRNQVTEELEGAVEELRILTAQLRQEVWLSQKILATELHGSVQAALNASALRLAQMTNPTAADLDRVREDVDRAISELGQRNYMEGQSFEDLMEQMCELWEGSCEINYRLTEDASSALADNPGAAYCTLEVVREAVNNAIRHGQSKCIDIDIKMKNELLALEVVNDGSKLAATGQGFGSQLYEELTLSHNLTVGQKTKLRALVPLSRLSQ